MPTPDLADTTARATTSTALIAISFDRCSQPWLSAGKLWGKLLDQESIYKPLLLHSSIFAYYVFIKQLDPLVVSKCYQNFAIDYLSPKEIVANKIGQAIYISVTHNGYPSYSHTDEPTADYFPMSAPNRCLPGTAAFY